MALFLRDVIETALAEPIQNIYDISYGSSLLLEAAAEQYEEFTGEDISGLPSKQQAKKIWKWYSAAYSSEKTEPADKTKAGLRTVGKTTLEENYCFHLPYRQSSFEDNLLGKNFPAAEFIQHFCAAFRLDCALCSDFLTAYGYLPLHAKNLHNLAVYSVLSSMDPPDGNPLELIRERYFRACSLLNESSGISPSGFLMAGCAIVPAGIWYVMNDPVRSKRIMVALNPFLDKQGTGYQAVQGLYSIASGGLFGQGLGQSIQKTSFLPEPYNDFIFAVVCEELGLLGAILVIALFCALIIRGLMIAIHAPDAFSSLTVIGIMSHIAIQTLFNICVVATIIPNTGITLPFFSYGGTAIIVLLAEMGIVLNISRHRKRNKN